MPKIFAKVMRNGVPFYTVLVVSVGILIGALLNVIIPLFIKGSDSMFTYTVHRFYPV
ncbi:amino acid permease [Staphylococcus saccharolyticus]|uniref:Amino acid permease n=1 Tax=Staphylococcus saccharolyticus TaxID=33028 RepID=A0A380H1D0_9STAP|nr:amino acid permease [Staphylococcus saccharolyticus]